MATNQLHLSVTFRYQSIALGFTVVLESGGGYFFFFYSKQAKLPGDLLPIETVFSPTGLFCISHFFCCLPNTMFSNSIINHYLRFFLHLQVFYSPSTIKGSSYINIVTPQHFNLMPVEIVMFT